MNGEGGETLAPIDVPETMIRPIISIVKRYLKWIAMQWKNSWTKHSRLALILFGWIACVSQRSSGTDVLKNSMAINVIDITILIKIHGQPFTDLVRNEIVKFEYRKYALLLNVPPINLHIANDLVFVGSQFWI